MTYIRRAIEPLVLEAAKHFLVILLTGPRQSGKAITLQRLFPAHAYVTFDDPIIRAQADRDPELFLADHPASSPDQSNGKTKQHFTPADLTCSFPILTQRYHSTNLPGRWQICRCESHRRPIRPHFRIIRDGTQCEFH